MTSANPAVGAWATHPLGKAARVAIAVSGLVSATLVMMMAAVVTSGSWPLVLLGVCLAALSVRAARMPTPSRLVGVTVTLLAVPLVIQVF